MKPIVSDSNSIKLPERISRDEVHKRGRKKVEPDVMVIMERQSVMRDKAASIANARREAEERAEERAKAAQYEAKRNFEEKMKKVDIGDTKAEVIRKAGQPDLIETLGEVVHGHGPAIQKWTYIGQHVDIVVTFHWKKVKSVD